MARKLDHTNHTTVQGWWDRSKIPVDRWAEIDAASKREGITFDMSELMPAAA